MPVLPPDEHADAPMLHPLLEKWFDARGWQPFGFQRQACHAYARSVSGLIHAPTGLGKTLAAWLGPVQEFLQGATSGTGFQPVRSTTSKSRRAAKEPLRVLWLTPLKALASDTTASLREPIDDLSLPWSIESRTGDSSASLKARQKERLPTALVTTPESLTLMLSYPHWRALFATLRCVVVDEWHELIGTKRGVQVELALARLRGLLPALRTWGLSATLGNIEQAAQVLVGASHPPERLRLIRGRFDKAIEVRTLIPESIERFPWSGHIGLRLLPEVVRAIESAGTTLLFTNTRAQAEIWFRALLNARPDWLGQVALHHGSLDRKIRTEVERRLGADEPCPHSTAEATASRASSPWRCVVCTSSLDLGVDFSPVDQVIQIGSPKGIARFVQRAGRSGHRPGAVSRVIAVPTHAMELVEFAAARKAIAELHVEARPPRRRAIDCLAQHLVTCAVGGGFVEEVLRREVRSTYAYADLSDAEWQWTMDFVHRGGASLSAYPNHAKLKPEPSDPGPIRWGATNPTVARWHRLNIGTIVAEPTMTVRLTSGRVLGTVEESFIAKLHPGQRFVFAGQFLELVRVRDLAAEVRRSDRAGAVPSWDGGKMPLSSNLADRVVEMLGSAIGPCSANGPDQPEMEAIRPLLEVQAKWSRLPAPGELLMEFTRSRVGCHAFLFPFAGRLVHEALASLLAHRATRRQPMAVSAVANDYGIELLTSEPMDADESLWRSLLSADSLVDDLLASLNTTQLARRQFREIARIAGLVLQSFPGQRKPARQIQASSELFFDVFKDFDPENLLLRQAERELLEGQLEFERLSQTLQRLRASRLVLIQSERLTPLAFPLWAEHIRAVHASSQSWSERIKGMVVMLESAADPGTHRCTIPEPAPTREERTLLAPEAKPRLAHTSGDARTSRRRVSRSRRPRI